MQKTSIDADGGSLMRHALNGATMGTRWSAILHAPQGFDPRAVADRMSAAVAIVDRQMSTWQPDSDLNRLNDAAPGVVVALPEPLLDVMEAGLAIGRASKGAFDIGLGDAVAAWGFGAQPASPLQIAAARRLARVPAHEITEINRGAGTVRKHRPVRYDLNGIAKGYGVDRLAAVAAEEGITSALLSIDGELRALGTMPGRDGWPVAIEAPVPGHRSVHSVIELRDVAIATSGDYRHYVEVNGRRLGHTIDPQTGVPMQAAPASVTVVAHDCMSADAWATAFMVMRRDRAVALAAMENVSVLVIDADGAGFGTGCFSHDGARMDA